MPTIGERRGGGRAGAPLLRRALDASVKPLNLVAPGVGAAAAGALVVLGLPPLALAAGSLAVAAWGAMVAWDLTIPPPPQPATPPPATPRRLQAPDLQQAIEGIRASAATVRARIDGHDGVLSASLLELQGDCDALVASADAMARRGDAAYLFLLAHDPAQIRQELEALRRRAKSARDPEAGASLQSAVASTERRLAAWSGLETVHARIAAELLAVRAALDELHVRVVQLTLQDPGEAMPGAKLGADLEILRDRVQVLERSAAATLKELA